MAETKILPITKIEKCVLSYTLLENSCELYKNPCHFLFDMEVSCSYYRQFKISKS